MTKPAPMKEKIWIIGASTGIGRSLAKELASQGHCIALSARDEKALETVHADLPLDKHLVAPLDVTNLQDIQNALDKILAQWGTLDRLIFMAGIYEPSEFTALNLEISKKILEVNLLGAFYVVETVLPTFLKQEKKGQIALCASVAGYRGLPQSQPYGASKAGLINMAESLRAEQGTHCDIKVINPGFVESRLTKKNTFHMPAKISSEQAAKEIAKGLNSSAFEIHFPKRFTFTMKILRLLPYPLYYRFMKKR